MGSRPREGRAGIKESTWSPDASVPDSSGPAWISYEKMWTLIFAVVLWPVLSWTWVLPSSTQSCPSLALHAASSAVSSGTTLINSTLVPIGGLNVSNTVNQVSFCQVLGSVAYGDNKTLNFQLWLPDEKIYQGRFMAVGNGGMAGTIDTANMLLQLNQGFAVAGGDAGHLASTNNNGAGAPNTYIPYLHNTDEVQAWIHNAISLFAPAAKSLVAYFYGQEARYSYYDGCSTGGAQGFALAQYHPDLFDGIVAGSPGNWYSHLALSFLWNGLKTQNSSFLPQSTLNLITSAVLDKCDTLDGVADRLIENPLICDFDIESLACNSTANTSTCLTSPQIQAAKAIYTGPKSALDGSQIYPGFSYGSEIQWFMQEQTLSDAFAIPILQNLVYDNLSYDYHTFNFGSDVQDVDAKAGIYIDEISTNLSSFQASGGKLLVTQGWADPYNAAIWPIKHMQDLQNAMGADISDFFNLFMIPGGGHCGAASGYPDVPASYHTVSKLVQWVERGEKPDGVVSTGPPNGENRSRLLCPWPQTAKLVPGGDELWWGSYLCEG
ncbi:putative feruloyl esterase B precursor [Hyaloscypha variabilis]